MKNRHIYLLEIAADVLMLLLPSIVGYLYLSVGPNFMSVLFHKVAPTEYYHNPIEYFIGLYLILVWAGAILLLFWRYSEVTYFSMMCAAVNIGFTIGFTTNLLTPDIYKQVGELLIMFAVVSILEVLVWCILGFSVHSILNKE
jgi:hypothetical protein